MHFAGLETSFRSPFLEMPPGKKRSKKRAPLRPPEKKKHSPSAIIKAARANSDLEARAEQAQARARSRLREKKTQKTLYLTKLYEPIPASTSSPQSLAGPSTVPNFFHTPNVIMAFTFGFLNYCETFAIAL